MTALLYVLLSLKITRQVDLQMKEFYKTRIYSDIQEFYREMEGYAALMENRIQRFKNLVERSEAAANQTSMQIPSAASSAAQVSVAAERKVQKKVNRPSAKESNKPLVEQSKKQASTPPKKTPDKKADRKNTSAQPAPASPEREKITTSPEHSLASENSARLAQIADDGEDTAIAAELMKDLFAQDEVQFSPKKNDLKPVQTTISVSQKDAPPATDSRSSAVMNILARIGKTVESALATPKSVAAPPPASPKTAISPQPISPKKNPDFVEVLRRAEQIKAEKQAERERAELEARAEFYSTGDHFVASTQKQAMPEFAEQKAAMDASNKAARDFTTADSISHRQPMSPVRNTLAVKNLDEHTIRFLVDSLRHDAGYRRQALRALTENNIPLEEIARLSRIDIAELQLMQQLDKF